MAKHEGFGTAPSQARCALCQRPVNRHSDSYEERMLDGSRRLYHRKRCWPREVRNRKRYEKRERRRAALASRAAAENGHVDKTEHFVEPTPPAPRSADGMFDFSLPGVVAASQQRRMPLDEDPVDRWSFDALLIESTNGRKLHPRRAERVLRLLIAHFKDRPFLLTDLPSRDPEGPMHPETAYEAQLRIIGKRTGRISHRYGGKGYPSTYLFHAPRPLARAAFHLDPALPHARELGAVQTTITLQEETIMSETPTPPVATAAPTSVSPLRRKMQERAAAVTPAQPIDPVAIVAKLDELEEYIATILDDYRRDLRKALGLDG